MILQSCVHKCQQIVCDCANLCESSVHIWSHNIFAIYHRYVEITLDVFATHLHLSDTTKSHNCPHLIIASCYRMYTKQGVASDWLWPNRSLRQSLCSYLRFCECSKNPHHICIFGKNMVCRSWGHPNWLHEIFECCSNLRFLEGDILQGTCSKGSGKSVRNTQ